MASRPAEIPPYVVSDVFNKRQVVHGFFGREGGVSAGPGLASLNTGLFVNDDADAVHENRARIAGAMGLDADHVYSMKQVHGKQCWYVSGVSWPQDKDQLPEGDALVTNVPGRGLGILSADCAPVLFAAPGIVAAAHAGYKGAIGGVLEATIASMEGLGAKRADIVAVIGPCIAQASYEFSKHDQAPFYAEDPASNIYFKPGATPDKVMFDLPGYCAFRLKRTGIRTEIIARDTFALDGQYFSHRRNKASGRQMSVICLKA
jgi:YfiH family protein